MSKTVQSTTVSEMEQSQITLGEKDKHSEKGAPLGVRATLYNFLDRYNGVLMYAIFLVSGVLFALSATTFATGATIGAGEAKAMWAAAIGLMVCGFSAWIVYLISRSLKSDGFKAGLKNFFRENGLMILATVLFITISVVTFALSNQNVTAVQTGAHTQHDEWISGIAFMVFSLPLMITLMVKKNTTGRIYTAQAHASQSYSL